MRKSVMISDNVHEWLAWASQKYGIKMGDVVGVLVNIAKNYNVLEPDWIDRIVTDRLEEYRKKIDEQTKARLEQRRFEWKLKIKHDLLMHYVKTLEPQERKEFIEQLMGDMNDPRFLEHLDEMEVIILDGKRKLVRVKDGKPILNVDPERVVVCEVGYHIKGNFCSCKRWRECSIRLGEYAEFKAQQDMRRFYR